MIKALLAVLVMLKWIDPARPALIWCWRRPQTQCSISPPVLLGISAAMGAQRLCWLVAIGAALLELILPA